ncbi:thyroid transcription factor 1-associated protein 26 homolog [Pholidichthys leucotaenia]
MALTDQKKKKEKITEENSDMKNPKSGLQGVKKKRKWVHEHSVFKGSVKEGQGFAFKKKQRVKHEYNKLLRKERKKNHHQVSTQLYNEKYPEHLRHLYVAEAERLKSDAWTNRVNRSKLRVKGKEMEMAQDDDDDGDTEQQTKPAKEEVDVDSELRDSSNPEKRAASEKECLPMSNRRRKKIEKKTSFQKTKEEFERIREKRRKKKEEYLKNKQQREEALQKYSQKKAATFQMLCKKTKKGQPNLNLQMEYLLQKIQRTEK